MTTVLVTTLLVATVAAPAAAVPPDTLGDTHAFLSDVPSVQSQQNNSTSHHVNPANTSQEGDLIQVRGWLVERLSNQLGDSAVKINQREYELGRQVIGDQYDSRLGQLVDVVGETESESDDDFGDSFTAVRQTQRNYSDTAQTYQETYEAYQQAVQNGNETEARRQARRLQELEDRIQRQNGTLVGQYQRLENQTGTEFTEAITAITTHSENISTQQAEIEEDLFIATTLRVSTNSEPISYEVPLVARGQLTTENGTPVSNREITIQIHTQVRQVETDADGRFTLRYRPRTIHVDTSILSIRYIPRNESAYLGSNTTRPVEIEPVEANLSIRSVPSSASFQDRFAVTPALTIDGEPVTRIPVEARVGTLRLAERQTNKSGAVTLEGTIPASLSPGQRQILVSLADENRAVQASTTTVETTLRSTETTLTVRGEQEGAASVRISGHLQTENGVAIPSQSVRITINESIERSVETGPNGRYSVLVNRSELPAETQSGINLTVIFDGQGTNLNSSSLSARVEFTPFESSQADSSESNPPSENDGTPFESSQADSSESNPPSENDGISTVLQDGGPNLILVGVLVVITALSGGGIIIYRRYYGSDENSISENEQSPQSSAEVDAADKTDDLSPLTSLIEDNQPDVAIQYAYRHIRNSLATSINVQESDTHWEFFNKCRDANLDRERLAAIQDLVEAYEQVQFYHKQDLDFEVNSLLERIETDQR